MAHEKFTSYGVLFFKMFDVNVSTILLIQSGYFFKIIESDLLEITSYVIRNARIASWHYLYSNFRKKWVIKLIFSMQISINVFYVFIPRFWVYLASHAQSTQNSKFAISFAVSVERCKGWSYFLPADKHQSFLQRTLKLVSVSNDTIIETWRKYVFFLILVLLVFKKNILF